MNKQQHEAWRTHYLPPEMKLWQGRADSPKDACFFQIISMLNLLTTLPKQNAEKSKPSFALIGFCCDKGIERNLGRKGAAMGPLSLRPYLAGLHVPERPFTIYDAGNIVCVDDNLESAQVALGEIVHRLLDQQITPIVIGGGHELALGSYFGIVKTFTENNIGIINFDAHFDMRTLPTNNLGTSGTPFFQMAMLANDDHRPFHYSCIGIQPAANSKELFKTAKQYNTRYTLAEDLYLADSKQSDALIQQAIAENNHLYCSLCLDVFSQSYAPGVSAPQALGLFPWQVIPLLRKIAGSGKTVSYDIAELSPQYDLDNRTVKLAASMVYEIIAYHQGKL